MNRFGNLYELPVYSEVILENRSILLDLRPAFERKSQSGSLIHMKAFAQACRELRVGLWAAGWGLVVVSSAVAAAAESPTPVAPPPGVQTVRLEFQDLTFSFLQRSLPIEQRSAAFDEEPDGVGDKVLRGFLSWGRGKSNSVAFIWDKNAGRLYLDQNRNQNLADDLEGNYTSQRSETGRYQGFTNVRVPLGPPGDMREVLVDLNLYSYGSHDYCVGGVRSMWAAKVTLGGEDWQVGVIPGAFGQGASEKDRLLLRPWTEREQSFSLTSLVPETFDFPDKLFLNGKAYEVDRAGVRENGRAGVDVRFRDQSPTLGDLQIKGRFIDRLALFGDEYLVLLDHPGNEVEVPVGHYTASRVRVLAGDTKASRTRTSLGVMKGFSVVTDGAAVLATGGPLTNSVSVNRRGRSLSLSYRLIGVDGETYQLEPQDRSHPPEFAVYRGDKQIASGKFEFG